MTSSITTVQCQNQETDVDLILLTRLQTLFSLPWFLRAFLCVRSSRQFHPTFYLNSPLLWSGLCLCSALNTEISRRRRQIPFLCVCLHIGGRVGWAVKPLKSSSCMRFDDPCASLLQAELCASIRLECLPQGYLIC